MRSALIILLVVAVGLVVVSADSTDDAKCRAVAKTQGYSEAELAKVGPMRIRSKYHPRHKRQCRSVCNDLFMNFAFDYDGGKNCCCGMQSSQ